MKKFLEALQLIRFPNQRIAEPDGFTEISLSVLQDEHARFMLNEKCRLTATFAVDFYWEAGAQIPSATLTQAKRVLLEALLGDIRFLVEKLRLSIITRDGDAADILSQLEQSLFEI